MTEHDLKEAENEAYRFIIRSKLARERIKGDRMVLITGSKETATAKRASMDLTRALVKVR